VSYHRHLPNHEFVVSTAGRVVGVGGCEEVICDVGTNVLVAVAPLYGGLHAVDLADRLLRCDLFSRIGIRLHVVLATRPLPGCVPSNARTGDVVDVGALGPRAGVLAPHVVIDLVAIARIVTILVTKSLHLCKCDGRKCGEGDGEAFHVVDLLGWWLCERLLALDV
jgi:hypothetical protein